MEDRRLLIADTAISVIANSGIRGLTHRAIDRAAEFAPGSTSYYARSKAQLVALTVERLASLLRGYTEYVQLATATPSTTAELLATLEQWLAGLYDNYIDELRARASLMLELERSEGEDAALLQDALLTAADLEGPATAAGLPHTALATALPELLSGLEGCLWEHAVGRQLRSDSTSVDARLLSAILSQYDVPSAHHRGGPLRRRRT